MIAYLFVIVAAGAGYGVEDQWQSCACFALAALVLFLQMAADERAESQGREP